MVCTAFVCTDYFFMRQKTQAIVLHLTPHSDSMSVLNLYTRDFGRIDYAVYGLSGKKGKMRRAMFEPLSLLEIDVNHQPTQQLQRLDDVRLLSVNHQIALDIKKRTICMFIAEILYRVLRHPMTDEQLFDFLMLSVETLEYTSEPKNFHLSFLLRLTQFIGCYPNFDISGQWFDLRSGEKTSTIPLHPDFLNADEIGVIEQIAQSEDLTAADVELSRQQRAKALQNMLAYYSLHVANMPELKSLEVLTAIFD